MPGMVSPMLAMADPKARLRLVWIRSRLAAREAASVSGSSTSRAITTPTNDERKTDRGDTGFDGGGLDLCQSNDGDQRQQQETEARQRPPPTRRIGMFLRFHHVPSGGDRQEEIAMSYSLREDEYPIQG